MKVGLQETMVLLPWHVQGRYTTDDGYIFNASDIIEDTGDAYIVPHGDHYHYIPKSELSASELAAAEPSYLVEVVNQTLLLIAATNNNSTSSDVDRWIPSYNNQGSDYTNTNTSNNSSDDSQAGQSDDIDSLLKQLYKLPLSQRHVESDGLIFDPAQITSRTARGVAVPHGDHYHFILIHRCLNWKNESLASSRFAIVRTIGCRIQDQNNQVHNRFRNLVRVRNLHQLLNQLQAIQLMKNWLNR